MIKIKQAVIVEGKYDKMRLSAFIDAPIIETNGFRIFRDKEKVNLIKKLAQTRGLLILTDSDSAGFVIRNYLKGLVPPETIKNAYIPPIPGKEKRKQAPSREGTLGVEGLDEHTLIKVIRQSGADCNEEKTKRMSSITREDFYRLGLSGGKNSAQKRRALLQKLELPEYLSTKAMLEMFNCLFTLEELEELLRNPDESEGCKIFP